MGLILEALRLFESRCDGFYRSDLPFEHFSMWINSKRRSVRISDLGSGITQF